MANLRGILTTACLKVAGYVLKGPYILPQLLGEKEDTLFKRTRWLPLARNVAFDFVRISVLYFLIGIFWMGIIYFLGYSGPATSMANDAYHWAMYHVMLIGWASFAIIGVLYYLVPRMAGKEEMYSRKLGVAHFWLTNIMFPIGVVTMVWASFVIDTLASQGLTESQIYSSASAAPFLFTFLIAVLVAFGAQVVFAYNIFKTLKR